MSYVTCDCGRTWPAKTDATKRVVLWRCRKSHVLEDSEDILLADKGLSKQNTLVVILSHRNNESQHRVCKQQILDLGFEHVITKYGALIGKTKHKGKVLKSNEVCSYGFRHVIAPAIKKYLQDEPNISGMLYLEADAALNETTAAEIFASVRSAPKTKDVIWIGWYKIHLGKFCTVHGERYSCRRIIQGSQAVFFRRRGLIQAHSILMKKRLGHIDLCWSRYLKPWLPPHSLIGTRSHTSKIAGRGKRFPGFSAGVPRK